MGQSARGNGQTCDYHWTEVEDVIKEVVDMQLGQFRQQCHLIETVYTLPVDVAMFLFAFHGCSRKLGSHYTSFRRGAALLLNDVQNLN